MSELMADVPGRLDVFLSSREANLSRAKAHKLIKNGCVKVNGSIVKKPAYQLQVGDAVGVEVTEQRRESHAEPEDLRLEVLYEDDACMVLNKPAGIAVHPASSMGQDEKTLLNGIAHLFSERGIPFSPDATLVHRLDKETTGVILIAKNSAAHAALQKQFEERTVTKIYLALVAGVPDPADAIIDAPVGRSLINRLKMSVLMTGKSREAKTTYRTLKSTDQAALLECQLHTGRTHQIRVHLSSVVHCILGDPTYNTVLSRNLSAKNGIENLCLHAWKLTFVSPADDKKHMISAPYPEHLIRAVTTMGLRLP